MEPEVLDDFGAAWSGTLSNARLRNGSRDIIGTRWLCEDFNSPKSARAPLPGDTIYEDGFVLRKAFQDILRDPEAYQNSDNVTPSDSSTNIGESGLLTNTSWLSILSALVIL